MKLGITPPSRNTVKNILKAGGLDPDPKRGEATWDECLRQHAASWWQCDFFSRNVLTPKGIRQAFVLAFLQVETRRVVLSPATFQLDEVWVSAQAESFVDRARAEGIAKHDKLVQALLLDRLHEPLSVCVRIQYAKRHPTAAPDSIFSTRKP